MIRKSVPEASPGNAPRGESKNGQQFKFDVYPLYWTPGKGGNFMRCIYDYKRKYVDIGLAYGRKHQRTVISKDSEKRLDLARKVTAGISVTSAAIEN